MMLSPYRVLDLTGGPCALGPMILADLGAEVVRIDQPGQADDPILEHVYNRNKQRLALDLTSANGKTRVLELARGADFVCESAGPGVMDGLGLGYAAMRAANPEIVYVATS